MAYSDSGLPGTVFPNIFYDHGYHHIMSGMLFSLLDTEDDDQITRHAQETITSVLVEMAADNLSSWFSLCKEILTVSVDTPGAEVKVDNDDNEEDDDDDVELSGGQDSSAQVTVQPRWTTR